jgi:hypothetical protein
MRPIYWATKLPAEDPKMSTRSRFIASRNSIAPHLSPFARHFLIWCSKTLPANGSEPQDEK